MSFLIETPADARRRVGLRRMRVVATALLVVAAIIYVATLRLDHSGVWGYVNMSAHAAMVGALADWFAVTALFKHPLGIPIPHTALVKKRKDELGRSLQEFVTDNFLTEDIARERLASAQVALRLGRWLGEDDNRHRVLTEAVKAGRAGLGRMKDEDVEDFLTDLLLPRLAQEPISPIAGALLDGMVTEGTHAGLVDLGLDQITQWLRENPDVFAEVVGEKAPWWSPPWLDERVIGWGYQQTVAWLVEMRADHEHPARQALDGLLRRLADNLQHDEEVQAAAERLKERVLAHPQVPKTAVGVWQSVRTALLSAMDDEDSYLWGRGDELLQHFSEHLVEDESWRTRLEGHLGEAVAFAVNTYGAEIAEVISVTVERWDADEASSRIELFVGRDLQFIRINGTIVGALAGLVIHALSTLVV